MSKCAVESATNAHFEKLDKIEHIEAQFQKDIDDELNAISSAIGRIKSVIDRYDYDGYDMAEYAQECVAESIGRF